jgi:hypothetical protein
MPSSVRLQSHGLYSGEWLEHSLRGGLCRENTYIDTVFDSAQAERVPASVGRHGELVRSDEEARPERSRRRRSETSKGVTQKRSTTLLITSS